MNIHPQASTTFIMKIPGLIFSWKQALGIT